MAHNAVHTTLYLWLLAPGIGALALSGYFHSRALKLIDQDGPIEFVKNWQNRTELAASAGFAWVAASLAGLTGANMLGVMSIGLLIQSTPLIIHGVIRSYHEHRDVRRRGVNASR